MAETSLKTETPNIVQQCEKTRKLLALNPQRLSTIEIHLGLTKPQTLSVLQRLEEHEEIFCHTGVWYLAQN